MPLRVGTLSVRRPRAYTLSSSGRLLRPRVFRGRVADFENRYEEFQAHRRLVTADGLLTAHTRTYVPNPERISALEYVKACKELDQSPAGPVARELLFSYLSPSQLTQVRRHNYFDVGIHHRDLVEFCLDIGGEVELSTLYFHITRGFPNGNIEMRCPSGARYQLCLHPITPYPTDDICLAQMMTLLTDPEGFVTTANITPLGDSPALAENIRVFKRYRYKNRNDLILPYLKHTPVSDNIALGQE